MEKVEHGDVILADRGFDIGDDLGVYGARLEIPSYTRGKKQLSLQEVEHSKRLSKVRIHVEHVIGLLKNKFTPLQSTLQITMVKHVSDTDFAIIDKILTVCAALVNLCPSVVPCDDGSCIFFTQDIIIIIIADCYYVCIFNVPGNNQLWKSPTLPKITVFKFSWY